VFLEPVAFPTGALPWRKGIIVTAAPEIFYAEDTDGDGRADVHRTLFSGFHEGNQQHRVNHPRWGLDNWVHLANGDSGGAIRSAKTGEVVHIGGRDLRVRPDEGLLDPQAGQSQFGRNRDDWDNWFGCNNSDPGYHYAVADHYLRRNPHIAAPPGRIGLTGRRDSYPAGRVITHCFIPQPTPPEGTPGHWTSLCGAMIYRDDLFGRDYTGNLFVSDSVYNVVHRLVLTPQGTSFCGERAVDEQHSEFLGSADPWFRPATLQTGPDGALWVTDMHRFVIEHPEWIVPDLTNKLELRRYSDKGRIYRIYPVDKQPRPIPRLDKLDTAGLVAALDHPNGWQRDMAQQMLLWRADQAAVAPLETLVNTSPRPLARLHALCTLDGLNALRPEIVSRGLADEHPGVRRHAVRLSESLLATAPALGAALLKLADDPDPQVQLQLLYSLGEWRDPRAGQLLARLALRHADNPYLSAAAFSSAVPHVEAMLAELQREPSPARTKLLGQLRKLAAAIQADPSLTAAKRTPGGTPVRPIDPSRQEVTRLLGGAATMEQIRQAMEKYRPLLTLYGDPARGRKMFVEATCATCHRFQDLGERIGPDLETLIDRSPQTLLVAVIDPNRACIDRYVEHAVVTKQGQVLGGMLLEETSNSITLVDVAGQRRAVLRKDLDELIFTGRSHMPEGLYGKMNLQQMADLFAFLGCRESPPRQFAGNTPAEIVRGPDTAFTMPASAAAIYGEDVRFDPQGGCVTSWANPDVCVAWPLRNFVMHSTYDVWVEYACADAAAGNGFVVQLSNGQSAKGKVAGTGGWDKYRPVQLGQVAIAAGNYRLTVRPVEPLTGPLMNLRSVKLVPAAPAPGGNAFHNAPEKVKQGKEGTVELSATKAEVHGPGVIFEPRYGNLGCWYSAAGFGRWIFEVRQGGKFDLHLDWACQDSIAGNRFQVMLDDKAAVEGRVLGTGTWDEYRKQKFGQVQLDPGVHRLEFRAVGEIKNALLDLRTVLLVPEKDRPGPSP
jgi:putative membrane-bound dehydrogenase-like protein